MATTINGNLANSAQVVDGLTANLSPRGPAQDQYVVTYDDTTGTLILTAAGGGGGMSNPMTTLGDLIFGQVGGTPARLPIATEGYVLRVGASSLPEWYERVGYGLLAARPTATALNEGQMWWATDEVSGLEFSVLVHQGAATYTWLTVPYGVTVTGAALVAAANAAAGRTTLGLGGAAILNVGTTAGTVAAGDAPVSAAAAAVATVTTTSIGAVPTSRTVNGHALTADVAVTGADVGLGAVTATGATAAVARSAIGVINPTIYTKTASNTAVCVLGCNWQER